MSEMDKAIGSLERAHRILKTAHFEACQALAEFDALDADQSQPIETRIAARSIKQETLSYCERMLRALEHLPIAALQLLDTVKFEPEKKVELPCIKTAAWMLRQRKRMIADARRTPEGVVATSARHGRPILTAISCLMIALACNVEAASLPLGQRLEASSTVDRVIAALEQIESTGNTKAVGDNGKAVGLLQIHPIAVSEANRIAGENRWKLSDRLCPQKSRAMARTILTWHYQRGVTDPVDLACRWNKPFGQTTAHYRAKVRTELAKI